jgi:type I restriction-modification system DNA methylase subunit
MANKPGGEDMAQVNHVKATASKNGRKLTLPELERFLWESANILRGKIDSSDYKNYIFGLLFLKRISDVFEEEAERIEKETSDKELAWDEPCAPLRRGAVRSSDIRRAG